MYAFASKRKLQPVTTQKSNASIVHRFARGRRADHSKVRNILQTTPIQAKLTVGSPNDKYEQEADRVSNHVMRMSDAEVAQRVQTGSAQPLRIQRMCPECEKEQAQRQPAKDDEEEKLQAKEQPGQMPHVSSGIESRINGLKGGGKPLDAATRTFFEQRFGRNFSRVRVHQGGEAADLSRSINARAFTLGSNVVFGSGEYRPQTQEGKRLLGHELTHVVQQSASSKAAQTVQKADSGTEAKEKPYCSVSATRYDKVPPRLVVSGTCNAEPGTTFTIHMVEGGCKPGNTLPPFYTGKVFIGGFIYAKITTIPSAIPGVGKDILVKVGSGETQSICCAEVESG